MPGSAGWRRRIFPCGTVRGETERACTLRALSKRPALRSHGEKRLITAMTRSEMGDRVMTDRTGSGFSRRGVLKGMGAGIGLAGVAGALPGLGGSGRALAAEPLKLGFQ